MFRSKPDEAVAKHKGVPKLESEPKLESKPDTSVYTVKELMG